MVVEVLSVEIVDIRRGNQWSAALPRNPHDLLIGLLLIRDAIALHLEIDLIVSENRHELIQMYPGVVGAVLYQPPTEARLQATRQSDHALGMPVEEIHVHVGLPTAETLEVGRRGELDEIPEADIAGGQERQVIALVLSPGPGRRPIVDEVCLQTEDGFDPCVLTCLVVIHRSAHHTVVGESQRWHPEIGGSLGHPVDIACAVEQRVLAVDVEVN